MLLPEFNDATARAAGWLTALGGILAGLWKTRLWLRADAREDRAGARGDDAGELAQDVWERTVARLQETVERMDREAQKMAEEIITLRTRLNTEVGMRYAAEGQSRRDGWRIQALEDELERIKAGKGAEEPAG